MHSSSLHDLSKLSKNKNKKEDNEIQETSRLVMHTLQALFLWGAKLLVIGPVQEQHNFFIVLQHTNNRHCPHRQHYHTILYYRQASTSFASRHSQGSTMSLGQRKLHLHSSHLVPYTCRSAINTNTLHTVHNDQP